MVLGYTTYGVETISWERSPKECIDFLSYNNDILDEFGPKPHQGFSVKNSKENTDQKFIGREFQLKLNDVDKYEDLRDELQRLKQMDYFIAIKEKDHIRIYCHYNQAQRLSKKILGYGVDVELCRWHNKRNPFDKTNGEILDEIIIEPKQ